jgi:hypothetical protein
MTYDELRGTLNQYMHRTDPETVANELNAIELARLKLARYFFPEQAANGLDVLFVDNGNGSATFPLPADFGQVDTVATSTAGDLQYVTIREFARLWARRQLAGVFTISGTGLSGDASLATAVVRMSYYRAPERISGTEENWCSQFYGDVWLWQAIAEQHRFVQDAESAQLAEAYSEELAMSATNQTRANREGGVLRMSTR